MDATWRAEGGAPSFAALQECDLLLGCIYEALRLFPTVPMTAKILDADREVAGVRLRKGTAVAANKAGVAAMPSCFPEPDKFDPSRFRRNEHGKHGANMHAFGGGPRACVGLRLAELEMLSILAHVLRHFRLTPVEHDAPVEHADVTNGPKHSGLRLVLALREEHPLLPS